MASAIVSIIVIGVLTFIVLVLVGKFALPILQPKLADFLHAPFGPQYTPCVAVSARIDGEMTYRENNLKRIPLNGYFFLKFDVSIRRRGLYWGDKEFDCIIKHEGIGMKAIEYSGENKPSDTFKINVSRYTGKNTIVFRCEREPLENHTSDTLLQITIKVNEKEKSREILNKTIALVFVLEQQPKAESAAAKVSIDGTVTVKIEKQGKNGKPE
jgi:HSP20 family molecular chaperone IbpA